MDNNEQLDLEKIKNFEKQVKQLIRNEISLKIEGEAEYKKGATRFGGIPDVPAHFKWPYFDTATWEDEEVKPRPLDFIAQFNLEEIAPLDKDNLLPKTGLLSFFHVTEADNWGETAESMKCLRVFWFEDVTALKQAEVPEELKERIFPMIKIQTESKPSFIDYEDYTEMMQVGCNEYNEYDKACENLGYVCEDNSSKLLGWAELVQANITTQLELTDRGFSFNESHPYDKVPEELRTIKSSPEEWLLLLQLDTVYHEDFELMYGDCGRLYVYIRKEDLKARRFDKVLFNWQCG